jgi:hypothetical protein
MGDSRREFLLKMAKGAAYVAPVVVTLSTPDGLLGQGQSTNSQKGGMGKGKGQGINPQIQAPSFTPRAPWQTAPPGTTPPGTMPPGTGTGPPGGIS